MVSTGYSGSCAVLGGIRIASTDRRPGGTEFRRLSPYVVNSRMQNLRKAQRTAAVQDAAAASAELQQQVDNLKAKAAQAAKRVRSKHEEEKMSKSQGL